MGLRCPTLRFFFGGVGSTEAGSWFVSTSRVGTCDLAEEERLFLVVLARLAVVLAAGVSVEEEVSSDVEACDLTEEERFFLVVLARLAVAPETEVSVSEAVSSDVGTCDSAGEERFFLVVGVRLAVAPETEVSVSLVKGFSQKLECRAVVVSSIEGRAIGGSCF